MTEVVFDVRVLREHTSRFGKLWAAGWANRATGRADAEHFVPMQIFRPSAPDADLARLADELTAVLTQCRIAYELRNSGEIHPSPVRHATRRS
jgi:hypothetical protein